MFGIGLPEMIIIAVVALIFIGPDKLPGVLRSIGKGLVELKRATSDVRSTVQEEMQKIEEEIELKEVRQSAQDFKNELGALLLRSALTRCRSATFCSDLVLIL